MDTVHFFLKLAGTLKLIADSDFKLDLVAIFKDKTGTTSDPYKVILLFPV